MKRNYLLTIACLVAFSAAEPIPVLRANRPAHLQSATDVVISAEQIAVATTRPTLAPTIVKRVHPPSITAVDSAHDGMNQGDLVVSFDQDLAARMQEIMMRSTECEEGTKFDHEHPSGKKRANSRLGRAICAYQGVMFNMGSSLSDLMRTDLGNLNFAIPTTPPDRAAAAELTEQLLEDYAPVINLQLDRARALAAYLFALAIGVVIDNQRLGSTNKIPATLVSIITPTGKPTPTTASPTTSSSSGCPDPTKTPLLCGRENEKENSCEAAKPQDKNELPKCAQKGEYSNCPCEMPTDLTVQSVSGVELKAMNMFMELFRRNPVPATPSALPETPKTPTRALGILTEIQIYPPFLQTQVDMDKMYWLFFATDYGKPIECRDNPALTYFMRYDHTKKQLWYPGGEFPLVLFGERCTYRNSGDNVGKLFCGDKAIECFWDPREKDPAIASRSGGSYPCPNSNFARQTIFTCPY